MNAILCFFCFLHVFWTELTPQVERQCLELKPQEGKAVFLLRKAMQKLTAATPENFEASQKDFEETIKVQLEAAALPATCRLFSIDFSISAFSYQPGVKSARQLEAKKIT